MHVTSRIMKTTGGRLPEAIPVVNHVIGILNEKHGSDFGAAVMIGGDPAVIGITGMWESLGDLEKYRASMMADQEVAGVMRLAAPLFTDDAQDTIWKIHMAPGEPQAYTGIFGGRVNMARLDEVATFAAEAAGIVKGVTGNEIGIATAVTGDRSRLIWVGFAPDLATMEANSDALEANDDYMALFKKGADIMVPGSLESDIWQTVSG